MAFKVNKIIDDAKSAVVFLSQIHEYNSDPNVWRRFKRWVSQIFVSSV